MTIHTDFQPGQKAWIMYRNAPHECEIVEVHIGVWQREIRRGQEKEGVIGLIIRGLVGTTRGPIKEMRIHIFYEVRLLDEKYETKRLPRERLFRTKEELIDSLR